MNDVTGQAGRHEAAAGWDALEARVGDGAAALPSYRRVWFLSLIRQGREAEAAGRAALAAHCRERVARELAAIDRAPAGPGAPEDRADARTRARVSPLDELAARQGQAARARLLALLARHRDRLPRAEREAFEAAAADAAPATVTELRRRLVDRLLRAGRYRRQAARLAAWKPLAPESTPAGPYNDYRALEDVLQRTAARDGGAEWVAEFFDLYETMQATRRLYGQLLPGSKN